MYLCLIVTLLETLSIQLWSSLYVFSFIFASWWGGTQDIWGSVLNWRCEHNLCAHKQFFYYVMSYVTIFSSQISHKRVSHLSLTSACLSMEIQLICICRSVPMILTFKSQMDLTGRQDFGTRPGFCMQKCHCMPHNYYQDCILIIL